MSTKLPPSKNHQ